MKPDYLTAQEFANTLGVSRSTVYAWVREGKLHPLKAGKLYRFTRKDTERFLADGRGPAERKPEHDDLSLRLAAMIQRLLDQAAA